MADKKKSKAEKPPEKENVKEEDKKPAEGEAAEGGEGAAPAKKKLPLKLILIIVGVLVLLGGGVGALFMTGVLGGKKEEAAAEGQADGHGEGKSAGDHGGEKKDGHGGDKKKDDGHGGEKKDGKEAAVFYDLGEMMVNITGDGRRQTYLRLVVQLELESKEDEAKIDELKPRIVDNFQTYLRELRIDDLRGSAGLYRLREELLFRVTDAVHPIKVKDVLFQQMLVQ